jgi:hypothetical protein
MTPFPCCFPPEEGMLSFDRVIDQLLRLDADPNRDMIQDNRDVIQDEPSIDQPCRGELLITISAAHHDKVDQWMFILNQTSPA